MRVHLIGAILGAGLILAACQPPAPGPEAAVQAIYAGTATRLAQGHLTTAADLPLTPDLASALDHAATVAQQRNEPFIDGDLAANCQDCRLLTDVRAVVTAPPANGHAVVEAHFKLDGADTVVIWDMAQTPQGWRADNIRSPDGYDLRAAIRDEVTQTPASCTEERGAASAAALAAQCVQVSPATHPPCNAENACAMIEAEIARGCGMLTGNSKPAFCTAH